ncbi:N-acetylmuramoyl-L-alanine amidase family protein [Sporosalibacterium faouarense]|uniref:N-acetylmuramoyl-L-alanine amidase family protein n=1 Tax=Sporosalibacterium faouarense TaxID=516123 RepID=UPI00192AC142|nr:N-acetylmuramoyl-L-alanine amidase [Sporosalibacterium faouarense]
MKICIDPGHGGKDTGASKFNLHEKDVNLDIAKKLKQALVDEGIQVQMTRDKDKSMSLSERGQMINSSEFDFVVSVHNNSALSEDARGSEIIYPSNSQKGKELSQYILDELGLTGLRKRKVYTRLNSSGEDYYYMIREINPLSIIVECAFISNPYNNEFLKQEESRQRIALAIKRGIIRYKEKYYSGIEEHWAMDSFKRLRDEKLVLNKHDLDDYVTWGEFATLVVRLLDRMDEINNDN